MEESQSPGKRSVELKATAEGKNVSDAYSQALKKLEEQVGEPFDREEADVIVISEGAKGFLGMGAQMAKVEVRLTVEREIEEGGEAEAAAGAEGITPEEAAERLAADEEARRRLTEYLEKLVDAMGLEAEVIISKTGEEIVAKVDGPDMGLFIGRHGQTLDSIQYLANVIAYRKLPGRKRIIIDAEDYRERRNETLQALADRGANEILKKGKRRYEFKPMSAAERRVIHLHLQDRGGIATSSEGDEPYRRVVITRS